MTAKRDAALPPFPPLPDAFKPSGAVGDLFLRPFGVCERDLEVDFKQTLPPWLVTQLLGCCTVSTTGEAVSQDFFWGLTIGKRIECLLLITAASGWPEIAFKFRCPNQACAQELEVELSVIELAELQHQSDAEENVLVNCETERLELRKPVGNDQLAWLSCCFSNKDEAGEAMISSLLRSRDGSASQPLLSLSQAQIAAINQAMQESDPLVSFSPVIHCPDCDRQYQFEIDLLELLLSRLQQAQLSLLQMVHRLASHYHWSEQEIFAIPHWRRDYYLRFVAKDEER